jgi:hypothetical protein
MSKAIVLAIAIVLIPLALSGQEVRGPDQEASKAGPAAQKAKPDEHQRSGKDGERAAPSDWVGDLAERVAQAIEAVERTCAADIDDFCGDVTYGGGRVAQCMLAHEDRLSGRCRLVLYGISRKLKRSVDRIAEMCWSELQGLCGDSPKMGRCLAEKQGSLSPPCKIIVGAVRQRVMAQVGMAVYSSDNKHLGQIVDVQRGPEGTIQSIQINIGRILGLGTKVVTIPADRLETTAKITVRLSDAEVRSLPEGKKQ